MARTPATPPADDAAAPSDDLVRARWVSPQAALSPSQGLIRYGDEIFVTVEQLDHPQQPTIAWSDDWTPDPTLAAMAEQEG